MIQVRATPRRPCEPTEEEVDAAMRIDPRPTPQHIPVGNHGAWGSTGAARDRRKKLKHGVASGYVNPHTKNLSDAEKQLRGQLRKWKGGDAQDVIKAQLKAEHMIERYQLWKLHQLGETSIEAVQAASKRYFLEKFKDCFGMANTVWSLSHST